MLTKLVEVQKSVTNIVSHHSHGLQILYTAILVRLYKSKAEKVECNIKYFDCNIDYCDYRSDYCDYNTDYFNYNIDYFNYNIDYFDYTIDYFD